MVFFEKKNQKTFFSWREPAAIGSLRAAQRLRKFFGSFFQKGTRTPIFHPFVLMVAILSSPVSARSADLTVLSSVATKAAFDVVLPRYEQQTGDRIMTIYDTGAGVSRRMEAGDAFDVAIGIIGGFAAAARTGVVLPEPHPLGTAVAAIAYRTGTPVPMIDSDAAFKSLMLAAPALGISDPAGGGASSVYVIGLFRRLGIEDAMRGKLLLTKPGEGAAPVADGRAPYAVAMTSEIAGYPGLHAVPIFPATGAGAVTYAVAVSARSAHVTEASALAAFLSSPDSLSVLQSKGFSGG